MRTLLPALALLAVGYLAGRIRPAHRASSWAWWQIDHLRATRTSWRWWAAQPVFACEIAVLLTTRPVQTVRAWRTRNDPPPRSTPIRFTHLPKDTP